MKNIFWNSKDNVDKKTLIEHIKYGYFDDIKKDYERLLKVIL